MNELKIIRSYTESLFYNTIKQGNEEKVYQQIWTIGEILKQNPKIREALCSPVVLNSDKNKIIASLDKINVLEKIVVRFLSTLIKKGRIILFPEMIKAYFNLLSESKGIKFVEITAAKKLAGKEINTITEHLKQELNKIIEVQTFIEPALIGGVVIKYDNKFIDCSVTGAIKKIEKLAKNTAF